VRHEIGDLAALHFGRYGTYRHFAAHVGGRSLCDLSTAWIFTNAPLVSNKTTLTKIHLIQL
jgi:hypothetical protein